MYYIIFLYPLGNSNYFPMKRPTNTAQIRANIILRNFALRIQHATK